MNTDNLYFKSKLANKLLKDVNELFHFQKTIDWETKAKERILLDFIKVEKRAEERKHVELDPFVELALWLLQNKPNEVFNNIGIGQDKLDRIKIMCGYTTQN
jgi:hypothetical protein